MSESSCSDTTDTSYNDITVTEKLTKWTSSFIFSIQSKKHVFGQDLKEDTISDLFLPIKNQISLFSKLKCETKTNQNKYEQFTKDMIVGFKIKQY